ncbi:hypothetical protein JW851_03825 [Candidatus Woesearchaeota archaeon]|nr:hypothetical protein [Candidatus Woesearchaeota archaeon]
MIKIYAIAKKTARKIKQPKILVSLFLAGIMIFSILGFMMSYQMDDTRTELEYNGYEFEQLYGGFQLVLNKQKIVLNYFPEQLENVDLTKEIKTILKNAKVLSVAYDSDSEYKEYFAEQQFNLAENLNKVDKYIISGMTNNTGYAQIPQITCSNATIELPVILFQEGLLTNITFNNNCIIANIASANDAYMAGDLLFYQIAGIME